MLLTAYAAAAQDRAGPFALPEDTPVALVADRVSFDERAGTVTASGSVVVHYGPRSLTATEIVYDSVTGRITAVGPLTLRSEEGSVIVADAAELDADLTQAVATGARALIADGAGRLAAVEGRRIDGRYTVLSKAVYSSCEVCPAAPTPLWAVRARRVIHDEVERVVHYENAVFEVLGAPVAWLPFFSHPDPTVRRRTGLLPPTFRNASTYGFAVQIPYFIVIDDSRDATLTPFVTSDDGPILIGEYRQAFRSGDLNFLGSGGWLDTASDGGGEWRGSLAGEGRFAVSGVGGISFLPGTVAGFEGAAASDKGYLRRYGFDDDDRLENRAFVERWGERGFESLSAFYVQTLREDEAQGTIPVALPEFALRREVADEAFGAVGFETNAVYLARSDGRDVGRFSAQIDWENTVILDEGLLLRGFGLARADVYDVADDPAFTDNQPTRLFPIGGAEARYPLVAAGPGWDSGARHVIEPAAQVVFASTGINSADIPNEDSGIVEFDETNLLDINRFPGFDRVESGSRVNLALRYERMADDPLRLDAIVGRVFRLSDEGAFSGRSGLAERRSDYVSALTVGFAPWVEASHRLRLSEDFGLNRNEVGATVDLGRARMNGRYVFLREDATAGALRDREEVALTAEVDLIRNWTFGAAARRDLAEDEWVRVGASLGYADECAELEFGLGRDFTGTADAPASTSVSLRVRLFGVADGGRRGSGVCATRR